MKINKYMSLLAAGLAMAACSSDEIVSGVDNTTPEPQQTEVSGFNGQIADGLEVLAEEGLDGAQASGTRSTISDGAFSSWNENDIVSISDGTLYYQYKPTNINGASCQFTVVDGKNQFDQNLTGSENFYVFYPQAAVLGWNGATVSSMVYAQQLYSENIDNGEMGAYMATKATVKEDKSGVNFSFKHCCSVVEVNLSTLGVTPKTVSLKSNSGVSLAGKISYDITNSKITVANNDATDYSYSTQSDVITLSDVASDATIARFYILPVQLKGGVTVTIQDTDGNYYTKSTSTDVGTASETITMANVTDGSGTAAVVCKPYYKKVNFGIAASATRKGAWMSTVPSNIFFAQLSIPGSHNSATSSVSSTVANQSKTQSLTIAEQLEKGVRSFDLRPSASSSSTADNIEIKHGSTSTGVKFKDALSAITSYLDKNPTEAVFVLLHEEDGSSSGSDANTAWMNAIGTNLDNISSYLVTIPTDGVLKLSACRGKMVVIARDPFTTSDSNKGCGKIGWSDNDSATKDVYTSSNHSTWTSMKVKYQDHYDYSNWDEAKKNYITSFLAEIGVGNKTILHMNGLNVAYKTLNTNSYISTTAPKVNEYVTTTVDDFKNATTPFGIMQADYIGDSSYDKGLLKMIVNQNYKYVFQNRTRVKAASTTGTGAVVSGDEYADEGTVYVKEQR